MKLAAKEAQIADLRAMIEQSGDLLNSKGSAVQEAEQALVEAQSKASRAQTVHTDAVRAKEAAVESMSQVICLIDCMID